MRRFTVRHVTVYRYSEPVGLGEHRIMFRPRASHDLRLIRTSLAIVPQPAGLHWIHDVFDNSIALRRLADKLPSSDSRASSRLNISKRPPRNTGSSPKHKPTHLTIPATSARISRPA